MSTTDITPRRELFVFVLGKTTHGSLSTAHVSAVRWDLPFEQPRLPEVLAYHCIAQGAKVFGQRRYGYARDERGCSASELVLQSVIDHTGDHIQAAQYNRRALRASNFGPYWVLLPVTDCSKHHGGYYARFHNWAVGLKREVKSPRCTSPVDQRRVQLLLEKFSPYLIFDKETDSEIARLRENGTCPVREWNTSPFEGAARHR